MYGPILHVCPMSEPCIVCAWHRHRAQVIGAASLVRVWRTGKPAGIGNPRAASSSVGAVVGTSPCEPRPLVEHVTMWGNNHANET